jgi:hypothetical protein
MWTWQKETKIIHGVAGRSLPVDQWCLIKEDGTRVAFTRVSRENVHKLEYSTGTIHLECYATRHDFDGKNQTDTYTVSLFAPGRRTVAGLDVNLAQRIQQDLEQALLVMSKKAGDASTLHFKFPGFPSGDTSR